MRFTRWVSIGLWLALVPAAAFASSNHRVLFVQIPSSSKWKVIDSKTLSLKQVSTWGAVPEVDREYGAKDALLKTFAGHGKRIQVVMEQASDPSAAFGLLTFYATHEMRPVPGVQFALIGPKMVLMARDDEFMRIRRQAPVQMTEADLRDLLISIGGAKQSHHAMDLMPFSLPSKGMVQGSEKYVLGPEAASRAIPWIPTSLIDFSMGAEVHAATYYRGGGTVTLLLLSYPTTQIARSRFKVIQKQLHLTQPGKPGQMYGRLDGSYLFLVDRTEGATPAQAVDLMNSMTVKEIFTRPERIPGNPLGVQLLQLFVANILLIMYLVGAALAGGVLMVIGRRLIGKWFPGSDWGHGGEGSLIQLHIEGR